jgi:hypothetical protein
MRNRWVTVIGGLAVAVSLASLAQGRLDAQAPAAAAKVKAGYTPPRTPDGRPDLTGFYNVATITPVERPAGYGNRLVMTDAEASAIERYEVERYEKDRAPGDGNRQAPPVGGDRTPTKSYLEGLFRAGGGTVGGYNLVWLNPGDRVLTVDGQRRTSLIVDPVDGRVPPMKAEARERNAAFQRTRISPDAAEGASGGTASQYDGPEARPLAERCLLGFSSTSGPPTLPNYFYNNLKQIVQTRDTISILNEMVHDVRIIRIGGTHPPAHIKKWMGDSIGRWEGDTLVVETTNFTNKTQFRGSGENLKVIERFTRTDDDTILYRFTVEDPTTWDRPWTGEYTWLASSEPLYEYACHEGNYALEGVLRGARVLEKDAAK